MEPRDRVIGPIAMPCGEEGRVSVSFGDLVRKLVLFEHVIIDSYALKEFPQLVHKFGYEGVVELLKSGRVRVRAEATGVAGIESQPKALGTHVFGMPVLADREAYMHEGLRLIDTAPGLRARQSQKLRRLVADRTFLVPETAGHLTWTRFMADLETNAPILKRSVALVAERALGRAVGPNDFDLRVEGRETEGFRSESDLTERFGVDRVRQHDIVAKGLRGVGELNERTELMDRYQGVTGFQLGELSLFEDKLGVAARSIDPDVQLERFERVLELVGLPDADPDPAVQDVNLPRLIEATASDEAVQFRAWLRGVDSLDDDEVQHELSKVREMVRHAISGPVGQVVRFAATTGIGLVDPVAGIASDAVSSLVLDKLVGESGPAAFVSRLYLSVFSD
jgi:hypothetical protein